jgi:hypothetical protein
MVYWLFQFAVSVFPMAVMVMLNVPVGSICPMFLELYGELTVR